MRLTLIDGDSVTLIDAAMRNGSVVGLEPGFGLQTRAVVAGNVRSIEVRQVNAWRTAAVASGVAAGVVAVIVKLLQDFESD